MLIASTSDQLILPRSKVDSGGDLGTGKSQTPSAAAKSSLVPTLVLESGQLTDRVSLDHRFLIHSLAGRPANQSPFRPLGLVP